MVPSSLKSMARGPVSSPATERAMLSKTAGEAVKLKPSNPSKYTVPLPASNVPFCVKSPSMVSWLGAVTFPPDSIVRLEVEALAAKVVEAPPPTVTLPRFELPVSVPETVLLKISVEN